MNISLPSFSAFISTAVLWNTSTYSVNKHNANTLCCLVDQHKLMPAYAKKKKTLRYVSNGRCVSFSWLCSFFLQWKKFYKCWGSGHDPAGTPERLIGTHNFNKLIKSCSCAAETKNLPNVRLREKEEKKSPCQHNSGPEERCCVHVTQHAPYLELG